MELFFALFEEEQQLFELYEYVHAIEKYPVRHDDGRRGEGEDALRW